MPTADQAKASKVPHLDGPPGLLDAAVEAAWEATLSLATPPPQRRLGGDHSVDPRAAFNAGVRAVEAVANRHATVALRCLRAPK